MTNILYFIFLIATYPSLSPVIKKQLKEESEGFFANYGLSDKTESISLTEGKFVN